MDVFYQCIFSLLYCPAVFNHFSPAPVKVDRAVRICNYKGLQWKFTLDWLIWSTVEKIAPWGWFPGGSKKWPNTVGQYSVEKYLADVLYSNFFECLLSRNTRQGAKFGHLLENGQKSASKQLFSSEPHGLLISIDTPCFKLLFNCIET